MRSCPSCAFEKIDQICYYQNEYYLHACQSCGMRFLDAPDAAQEAFDRYYGGADTSGDLQGTDTVNRLTALAAILPIEGKGLDIGGKWSQLQYIHPWLDTLNAGEVVSGMYDYFVLSHTLEHVYDVDRLMTVIKKHSNPGAKIFIEIPFWKDYNAPGYDFYWQHINKFRSGDVERLLHRFGYVDVVGMELEPFQSFHCYRVTGALP